MTPNAAATDDAARAAWVTRILAVPNPAETLLLALEELDATQDIATQAALFESVFWRADIRHYWVFHRMSRVYAELGRDEAAVMLAGFAAQMQPEWVPTSQPYRALFRDFVGRGMAGVALDVFERQTRFHPEKPIAERHEVEPLLRALGQEAPVAPAGSSRRRDHRVVAAEQRVGTPIRAGLGPVPHGLHALTRPMARDAIDVVELADGELLICHDAVVVCDGNGVVQPDLSVCAYPELVRRRFAAEAEMERHEVSEAVLILDAFPPPNLGHFLLDQVNRLELYRRAGADLSRALVVGPALRTAYQHEIAARAGISAMLGTDRMGRVRARNLWVSSECRALQHPAHLAAGWAIEHARAVLGGRGTVGRRRLYVSRADAATRRVLGEEALGAALSARGYETIVPGHMPYREQLECFRTASHVVAAHGAALAHLVLCPPGTHVLELFHPLYGSWAYAMLAEACGLDYEALVGRDGVSDAPELNDPALVDLGAGLFGERHMRVAPERLEAWLERVA